ncbi:hypothetical protein PMZ80_001076 [Knufia obscura]|uniref:Transcription factor domain-containing protein n=1 Tax=Knufia obscura TaxID=1635080 RepID=A0ABR0S296_9EURO|nr:hypothetical protein PMZ80_001076 [Knufia obscura]
MSAANDGTNHMQHSAEAAKIPRLPAGGQYGNTFLGVFRMDSTLNELIVFWQTLVSQPSPESQIHDDNTVSGLSSNAWDLGLRLLSHAGYGSAFMSSLAAYHESVTKSRPMALFAMRCHTTAIHSLREELTESVSWRAMGLALSVMSAEMAARDYMAVGLHSKFMIKCMQPDDENDNWAPANYRHVYLWIEIQRSTLSLTRPLIDLSNWQTPLESDFTFGDIMWEPNDTYNFDVVALRSPCLIKLFSELRYYGHVLDVLNKDSSRMSQESITILSSRLLLLNGRTLDYCVDGLMALERKTLPLIGRFRQCQQTAAALAALWWLRVRTHNEQAGAQGTVFSPIEQVYSAGPRILREMKKVLQHLNEDVTQAVLGATDPHEPRSVAPDVRLRMWILNVGRMIEQSTSDSKEVASPSYFDEQLTTYLQVFNLVNKPDILDRILQGFLTIREQDTNALPWLCTSLRVLGTLSSTDYKL